MIFVYPSILEPIAPSLGLPATYCPQNSTVIGSELQTLLLLRADGNLNDISGFNRVSTANGGGTFSQAYKKYGLSAFDFTTNNSQINTIIPNTESQGDLTIEFWAMVFSGTNNRGIFSFKAIGNGSAASNSFYQAASPFNVAHLAAQSPTAAISGSGLGAYPLNASGWSHYAYVFSNLTGNGLFDGTPYVRAFVDGVYRGSFTGNVTNIVNSNFDGVGITIGAYSSGTLCMNGFMDTFRITRGQRYKNNFDRDNDTGLAY